MEILDQLKNKKKKANCYKNGMEQIYGYILMNMKLIANGALNHFKL